eukprot:jgi/Ulvmu1/4341/UM002_0064.1
MKVCRSTSSWHPNGTAVGPHATRTAAHVVNSSLGLCDNLNFYFVSTYMSAFVVDGTTMSLVSILLLQRNVPLAAKYYSCVGFRVALLTDSWAELEAGAAKILLKRQPGDAQRNAGYSPFLNVEVADLQSTVEKIIPLGAELDGPIRFTPQGRIAAVRNPDGHMMSLYEAA